MKIVIFRDLINVIYFKKMTTKTLDLNVGIAFHPYCEKSEHAHSRRRILRGAFEVYRGDGIQ